MIIIIMIIMIIIISSSSSSNIITAGLSTRGDALHRHRVAMIGNGELGFDSREGAWEPATTSKEGSRRANYRILTQGGSDKK